MSIGPGSPPMLFATVPVNRTAGRATQTADPYAGRVGSAAAITAVVPIRSFAGGKNRLGTVLDARQREALARWTAGRVLDALNSIDVVVVTADIAVARWARGRGASVLDPEGDGLNHAVEVARRSLRDRGVSRMVVVHADLPLCEAVPSVLDAADVVLVPDRTLDGTNVLVLPTESRFSFAYGPGSFRRHLDAVTSDRSIRSVAVRPHPLVGLDLDTGDDLRHPLIAPLITEVIT